MSYAHNSLPDVTQTFQNSTLVKNWYEDRFQSDEAKATGRLNLTSAERTIPTLPGHEPQLVTTKQAVDHAVMTVPPPARVQKPSMYSAVNIEERLQTYGVAPPLTYTIGPNAAAEATRPVERHLVTTNQIYYDQKPQEARQASPDTFRRDATATFGLVNHCERAVHGEQSDQSNLAGGKGARGEITRNPKEAGSVYGVSVFADEYGKWGTALQGMALQETVNRKQTKYFP